MPLSHFLTAILAAFCGFASADNVRPVIPIGRCVGTAGAPAPAPAGGAPFDPSSAPWWGGSKEAFAELGYHEDGGGHRLLDGAGAVVTEPAIAWLNEPADLSREKVSEVLWTSFVQQGYRVDEAVCQLKDSNGTPLNRFTYRHSTAMNNRWLKSAGMEQLRLRLKGLKASAPIPREVIAQVKALAESSLPAPVERALGARRATVGSVLRTVDASYAESTRYFDGKRPLVDWMAAARPLVPGAERVRPSVPLEPEEKRLGDMFGADLEGRFARNMAGRDLLNRFRGADGRVVFPPILLVKTAQGPDGHSAAFFSPGNGSMVLNYWTAARYMEKILPPAELKRRAQELSTPRGMRLYLEAHPVERGELMAQIDEIFYHELIHAWQDRRDNLTVEMMRGNVPGANILSKEHEAFREQCRYVILRGVQEPKTLERSGYLGYCHAMLKNYDSFRDGITRQYMGGFAGSGTIADVVQIQRQRESTARRLMSDGLYQRSVQALKLTGLALGDEMLQDFASDYSRREQTFIKTTLPALRRHVMGVLLPILARRGMHTMELMFSAAMPAGAAGAEAARLKAGRSLAPRLQNPDRDFPLELRIQVFNIVRADAAALPWTPALAAAYKRDASAYARSLRAQAATKRGSERSALLANASSWEKAAQ